MTTTETPLSPQDAAKLLNVNVKTVYAMLASGLPHQRIGTRIIRIMPADLLQHGKQ
jgi:excisionase family DNA binding protein